MPTFNGLIQSHRENSRKAELMRQIDDVLAETRALKDRLKAIRAELVELNIIKENPDGVDNR